MAQMALEFADAQRQCINGALSDTRARLGQYMTPAPIARLMASMIQSRRSAIRLLDPGAGVGSLTAAVVDRLLNRPQPPAAITATCFEIDDRLCDPLAATLRACHKRCRAAGVGFESVLRNEDFIAAEASADTLVDHRSRAFDVVVMNPPYRKISSNSTERAMLRDLGIETSNLYSAFMLLGAKLLNRGGEFVSINPRSFCNGPYFRPFRLDFLRQVDLRRIHIFESRSHTFREDSVLQENVIVYGRRGMRFAERVMISTILEDGSVRSREVPRHDVWRESDPEAVIHLLADDEIDAVVRRLSALPNTLADLGITVSTGRVVDFRARNHLRQQPETKTAPLIFPMHMCGGEVHWPIPNGRKPNAIAMNGDTERLLVPHGYYVLIRRFSAKEERRRVVAALYDSKRFGAEFVGFDNKLNYLHRNGGGLEPQLAQGLVVYLNSTMLDAFFRTFSGHTQVNATDLKRLPMPTREQLHAVAAGAASCSDQLAIDQLVSRVLDRV